MDLKFWETYFEDHDNFHFSKLNITQKCELIHYFNSVYVRNLELDSLTQRIIYNSIIITFLHNKEILENNHIQDIIEVVKSECLKLN